MSDVTNAAPPKVVEGGAEARAAAEAALLADMLAEEGKAAPPPEPTTDATPTDATPTDATPADATPPPVETKPPEPAKPSVDLATVLEANRRASEEAAALAIQRAQLEAERARLAPLAQRLQALEAVGSDPVAQAQALGVDLAAAAKHVATHGTTGQELPLAQLRTQYAQLQQGQALMMQRVAMSELKAEAATLMAGDDYEHLRAIGLRPDVIAAEVLQAQQQGRQTDVASVIKRHSDAVEAQAAALLKTKKFAGKAPAPVAAKPAGVVPTAKTAAAPAPVKPVAKLKRDEALAKAAALMDPKEFE